MTEWRKQQCPTCEGLGFTWVNNTLCASVDCRRPVGVNTPAARNVEGRWYHDICLEIERMGGLAVANARLKERRATA